MAQHVYHWKHGWIPLDHAAALSKAKGNHALAAKYVNPTTRAEAGINSRRDVAKALLNIGDVPPADRPEAARQITEAARTHNAEDLLPDAMRRMTAGITAANFNAFGLNASGIQRASFGGYHESQRVSILQTNFKKSGYPREWVPGTVEKINPGGDGKVASVSVLKDDGTITATQIGKRGGGKDLRPLESEPGHIADARKVRAKQLAYDVQVQAKLKRELNKRPPGIR